MFVKHTRHPDLPPPLTETGVLGWLRINLFSSLTNTVLTLLGFWILYFVIPPTFSWAILDANWAGTTREDCIDVVGACWVFIKVRFGLLMYGFFPEVERWRIDLMGLLLLGNTMPLVLAPFLPFSTRVNRWILYSIPLLCCGLAIYKLGLGSGLISGLFFLAPFMFTILGKTVYSPRLLASKLPWGKTIITLFSGGLVGFILQQAGFGGSWPLGIGTSLSMLMLCSLQKPSFTQWQFWSVYLILPCLSWIFLLGDAFGLPEIATDQWGGLFLTLVIALVGMGASLPIGVLLALGRTCSMPVVRVLCLSFIEFARGVPLISVLFMASVMLPMMLPQDVTFNKLLRALIGVSLFYAAYMAEVVRGGLLAIPKGQYEAAEALGLRYWAHMYLIILPQALRLVIPGITNTFLGLMKDTTLVAVINLMDILGIMKSALADTRWLGFTKEAYFFAGLIFWVLCFIVSRYSLYLERRLTWTRKA